MPQPIYDLFRLLAPVYDHVFVDDGAPARVAGPLALPTDGWLLDAGGGTGRISAALAAQTGGVIVADVSHGMLRQARHKNGLHPLHGQVERLPFASGRFARILVVDAFHHFFHHEAAAQELWRVLQPGGRLVILEPNIARWPVKLIALVETVLLMRSRFFRAEAMQRMFAALDGAAVTVDADDDPHHIQLVAEKTV